MKNFPLAGSVYSFVSRGWQAQIGCIAGWAILLDYVLVPTVTSIGAAYYLEKLLPIIPYEAWLILFTLSTGLFNLFGIKPIAKSGIWLLIIGEIVIFVGFATWSYGIVVHHQGVGHLLSAEPFHFSSLSSLATATSIAMMSYLGFDAITTLSEEAKQPTRDIPRAIIFSVLIGATTMFLTGYLGVLVVPNWHQLADKPNWSGTALFYITKLTGGEAMAIFYALGFLLAMAVFNIVAITAASRLLFGMGRDHVLPKAIFGAVNKRFKTPHWNILLIVALEILIGSLVQLDLVAELVNFGALIGFILLNLTVIWLYFVKKDDFCQLRRAAHATWHARMIYLTKYLLSPLLGATILTWVLLHMHSTAFITGCIWLLLGAMVFFIKQRRAHKLVNNTRIKQTINGSYTD